MKYLIDANLPVGLSMWKGDDFVFVNQLKLEWNDREIWQYALNNNLIIVTKDSDFFHWLLATFQSPKVIYLKIGNMRLKNLTIWLECNWLKITELIQVHRLITVYHDRIETLD